MMAIVFSYRAMLPRAGPGARVHIGITRGHALKPLSARRGRGYRSAQTGKVVWVALRR